MGSFADCFGFLFKQRKVKPYSVRPLKIIACVFIALTAAVTVMFAFSDPALEVRMRYDDKWDHQVRRPGPLFD